MTPTPATQSLSFTGSLTQAQTKTHIRYPFIVPDDAIAVDLHLSYSPPHVGHLGNKLTLTLFDPQGFRGEGHRGGTKHAVHLDRQKATPGYIPGVLPPGEWTVQISAHAVLDSDPPLTYALEVRVTTGHATGAPFVGSPAPARVLSRTPGWFRGELHSHTIHSDGNWTLAQMWQRAKELGLDYFVLTDHNTISGLSEAADLPAERPLFIPGMEITSFRGHALALGMQRWIDWRSERGGRSSEDWINETHAAGGLFAIAHPFTVGDPMCTGCSWGFELPKPGPSDRVEAVEICNEDWDATSNDNPMMLAFWRRLITPAGAPTAIAGTDAHSSRAWGEHSPFTWIYASELSAAGILDGIRKGHVIVSFGPRLFFSAVAQDSHASGIPGSHLTANALTLRAEWSGAPTGARLHIVKGRETPRTQDVAAAGEHTVTETVTEPTWYTAELWAADGTPLAITNPIYVAPPSPA